MASNTITSRSILFRAQFYLAFVLSLLLSGSALAQSEKAAARPDRGTMPNGSYSVSDIENISLQNGNVNLSIPLVDQRQLQQQALEHHQNRSRCPRQPVSPLCD
jgi:hypothetical protein